MYFNNFKRWFICLPYQNSAPSTKYKSHYYQFIRNGFFEFIWRVTICSLYTANWNLFCSFWWYYFWLDWQKKNNITYVPICFIRIFTDSCFSKQIHVTSRKVFVNNSYDTSRHIRRYIGTCESSVHFFLIQTLRAGSCIQVNCSCK